MKTTEKNYLENREEKIAFDIFDNQKPINSIRIQRESTFFLKVYCYIYIFIYLFIFYLFLFYFFFLFRN